METKGKHASFKLSTDDGKQANHFSRSGATLEKWVRRFALAKVAAPAVGRGKSEQKGKRVSYKTVLNTCLSFLNEVKNLGKEYGC